MNGMNVFTSAPFDMSRVNIWGLVLMAVGLIVFFLSKKIAKENVQMAAKLSGVLIMMIGALGAMKLIGG